MARFVDQALLPGEQIVHDARVSCIVFAPTLLLGAVALLIPEILLIVPVVFLHDLIRYRSTELALTDRRVIAKFGFIWREILELPLDRIESVQVSQSIVERILKAGTVRVHGVGVGEVPIPAIDDPLAFRTRLTELLDARRPRR